jgi:hypothetical protein
MRVGDVAPTKSLNVVFGDDGKSSAGFKPPKGQQFAHTASLQARVEELERENAVLVDRYSYGAFAREQDRADAAEAEANRMREALEWYARPLNYERLEAGKGWTWDSNVDRDEGHLARSALRPADEPVTQREM